MTTLLCNAFRAVPLQDGRIQLEIESAQTASPTDFDPTSNKILYFCDIAAKLRKDPKTIQRMSTRKRNPLPIHRAPGSKPYGIECEIFRFFSAAPVITKPVRHVSRYL